MMTVAPGQEFVEWGGYNAEPVRLICHQFCSCCCWISRAQLLQLEGHFKSEKPCNALKWVVVMILKIAQKEIMCWEQHDVEVEWGGDMREHICLFIGGWLDFRSRYYTNSAIVSIGVKSVFCWWNVVKITRWWIWYVWAVNLFHLPISTGGSEAPFSPPL